MLRMTRKYELELLSLPFSRGTGQVIYVETKFNPEINWFIESHIEEIKKMFAREFLDFCYIPEVCERYWEMGELEWHFLPYDRKLLRGYGSHLKTCQVFNGEVARNEIGPSLICSGRGVGLGDKIVFEAYHLDLQYLDKEHLMMEQLRQIAAAYSRRTAVDYREMTDDDEVASMLDEMERLARALKVKGVKTEVFDRMIESLERPSQLVIDWRGHVTLPDFGNVQIRLNPMEKTLYHFFLNHPEGIVADELVGHRKELLWLYSHVSIFDDFDLEKNAVDSLLDEDKQTFYTNISRIKAKFTAKLGARIARNYYIRKDERGVYGIPLPDDLVSYENERYGEEMRKVRG